MCLFATQVVQLSHMDATHMRFGLCLNLIASKTSETTLSLRSWLKRRQLSDHFNYDSLSELNSFRTHLHNKMCQPKPVDRSRIIGYNAVVKEAVCPQCETESTQLICQLLVDQHTHDAKAAIVMLARKGRIKHNY